MNRWTTITYLPNRIYNFGLFQDASAAAAGAQVAGGLGRPRVPQHLRATLQIRMVSTRDEYKTLDLGFRTSEKYIKSIKYLAAYP